MPSDELCGDINLKTMYLITSSDPRLAANQTCWPAQKHLEEAIQDKALHADIGLGQRRIPPGKGDSPSLEETTYEWPIVNTIFNGIRRDAFMARHRANHVSIAYAPDTETTRKALLLKGQMLHELGVTVHLCGTTGVDNPRLV